MKNIFLTGLFILAVVSGQAQMHVDFDKKVDFTKYKTFKFEPGRVIRKLGVRDTSNTFINQYIDEAVTKDLVGKGLHLSNEHPDLVITYLAGAREKQQVQNYMSQGFYPYAGFYGYGMGGWWGPQWNNFWVRKYEEGTMIIDMYDAGKAQLIWRAYAVSSISNFNEKKFVDKQIHKSFKHFPPKA
jgi:hypothetical protein